jgi:Fasciclin domain
LNFEQPISWLVLTSNSPQITVSNTTQLNNILIAQINGVLSPPKDLASVLADPTVNLTSLAGIASIITLPGFYNNGTNATLAAALGADITKGYTLFAPSNDALQAAGATVSSLSNNQTALLALLGNHVRTPCVCVWYNW